VPPSLDPETGEQLRWQRHYLWGASLLPLDVMLRDVGQVAAASIIARHLPEPARRDRLALPGLCSLALPQARVGRKARPQAAVPCPRALTRATAMVRTNPRTPVPAPSPNQADREADGVCPRPDLVIVSAGDSTQQAGRGPGR
jgi:hypothetical protein